MPTPTEIRDIDAALAHLRKRRKLALDALIQAFVDLCAAQDMRPVNDLLDARLELAAASVKSLNT